MSGSIRSERQGHLVLVTLVHPGKFNAMTRAMWRELRQVFQALQADRSLRCVLVRGEGGHFCAGGDIAEYPDFRFSADSLRTFHEDEVWGGLQAMLDCDLPLVAQIEGNCMGAGVEIASCCDLRIAAESARFGAPIARLGFPMAPREAALLLREAGAQTLREMLLEAAVFTADQMHARGFLNCVAPHDRLAEQAGTAVQRIVALAPQAARMNKQALRRLRPLPQPEDCGLAQAYDYADSAEHREGIRAFLEKRPTDFSTP